MKYYLLANAFIFGSLIGSFLNVVILRLPENKSIVTPRSACPNCGFQLKWYHNIPILSYLFLRGKCSNCETKISVQYPLIEFICGVAAVVMFPSAVSESSIVYYLIYFAIFCSLLAQFVIDIQHHLLLDKISLFLLSIMLPLSIISNGAAFALIGGAVGFLFPLIVSWGFFKIKGVIGLGGGDIKLYGVLGVMLGYKGIVINIFLSCFLGAIVTLFLIAIKKMKKDDPIAFGPFIIFVGAAQIFVPSYFNLIIKFLI
jgi:prepilin signal peptidase PulO-like enzyme (type II secretory pathway)